MALTPTVNLHPDFQFITGGWRQLASDAKAVRYEVFVLEQKVPSELELDEMDEPSLHVVCYDASQQAVATARLLPDGHIGRMAVLQSYRSHGIGSVLLRILMQEAQQRGDHAVLLSAQQHAENFYQRHGFVREGDAYIEAGIAHISMRHVFVK